MRDENTHSNCKAIYLHQRKMATKSNQLLKKEILPNKIGSNSTVLEDNEYSYTPSLIAALPKSDCIKQFERSLFQTDK